jgi:hypothetical protein
MGLMVQGSNPGGERFSAPDQIGHGAYPASYTKDSESLAGVKRPACGFNFDHHIAPRLKKE